MTVFDDMMATGGAGLLMQVHGAGGAVVIGGKPYAAIVGVLRIEPVQEFNGAIESHSDRDVCQVTIQCPFGVVDLDTRLVIKKYTLGDASIAEQQAFHVRTIDSITDGWTTIQAWRESLAKVQARGTEGAA